MMKTPSFEQLRVVVAVAESKNFAEAAQKLGLTQPSISYKMKELEQALPIPLFQLEGRRKVLTHYGRALFAIAKLKSDELEQSVENLHRHYSDPKLLTLRIGGRSEILEFVALKIKFAGKIELISCTSSEAIDQMLNHKLDIAISYIRPDSTEVLSKRLFQSRSRFMIHSSWLKRQKLTMDLVSNKTFLTETPCVIYRHDGHMLSIWLNHLGLSLEKMNVKYMVEDWRTVERLTAEGAGYAFVPEYIQCSSHNVESIAITSQALPAYTFWALYEKGLKQIPAFKNTLEFKDFR